MQKIYINSLLNTKNSVFGTFQVADSEIKLDFSQVDNIALKDIERLLDLQIKSTDKWKNTLTNKGT